MDCSVSERHRTYAALLPKLRWVALMLLIASVAVAPRTIEALPATFLSCPSPSGMPESAKHITTISNTVGPDTYIDDEGNKGNSGQSEGTNTRWRNTSFNNLGINGNPYAVLVTGRCGGGTNNPHPIGMQYDFEKGWAIFNQDGADMPIGVVFIIFNTSSSLSAFVQQATPANTTGHVTYIDHPLTNGRPNATLQVTQNWNRGGGGGTYNPHTIGVRYDSGRGQWAILNQDFATMPINAAFNVGVTNAGQSALHRAITANTVGAVTYIDHPLINGNPRAILLATQNLNPVGAGAIYNPHEIAVGYDTSRGRWAIFNQDGRDIPANAAFNISIAGQP
jgi:hypothetical protein